MPQSAVYVLISIKKKQNHDSPRATELKRQPAFYAAIPLRKRFCFMEHVHIIEQNGRTGSDERDRQQAPGRASACCAGAA